MPKPLAAHPPRTGSPINTYPDRCWDAGSRITLLAAKLAEIALPPPSDFR
jgi:hypothetical protein